MMQFDRIQLGRQAKELGFVRDTFEKVCRLADVLQFISGDEVLSRSLALKGGTAINLIIFELPRLSVDIDLDFTKTVSREEMLEHRKIINERFSKYMNGAGYQVNPKSKYYHALDSFIYDYQNAGGMKDNIKIEINYMLRCHVFEPEYRITKSSWLDIKPNVLCVSPVEIFASKIVALLNRTAPRDLYDISNMLKFKLFDEKEKEQLRKCSVLYSAISSDNVPESFQFEAVSNMTVRQIRTDLYPVLRNSERFNLKQCQDEVINELSEILIPSMNDKEFWNGFRNGAYFPELIFGASKESKQIKEHPMALWKCSRNN